MAISNSFPPDVPKAAEEAGETASDLRGKAAELAGRAGETVREGYERAKDAWDEAEPLEAVREGGQAVVRTVERHPLATLGLGALGIGLIAWAVSRREPSPSLPDYGRWRGWLQDYGADVADAGGRALKSGRSWFDAQRGVADDYAGRAGDYAAIARDYADRGGRMLARRAGREPVAALIGIGLAIYAVGSLMSAASAAEPAPPPARKRASRR
ncbi:hypothetical protein [Bosea sp. (in: a-proteobacteria)]|uniref:hypothetical protein n=1 Tax=Bosea sp. (in: a-proteobacteria) TaxID=1871050 RepID=UPI00262FEFBC|nr:hypothetical protein [Bosea sp. (in: a-proteobacteria)]MCO5091461.1 hypothetical protein [Bosea sp. (in: a-proteobacteria)]